MFDDRWVPIAPDRPITLLLAAGGRTLFLLRSEESGGSGDANESTRTVLVAIGAYLGVALAKILTGSSAVAASAPEALADTANDLFLLLAQHRGSRRADDQHALGYGREAYFWPSWRVWASLSGVQCSSYARASTR
jgi:Cation efflux family